MPKINVNASILIEATPEKIYPIISDLNHWKEWSPWVLAEPHAEITVAKDGKYHFWSGEIIGSGNLKINEETENESLTMDLQFLKPWNSKAKTHFELIPEENGTIVKWSMQSSLPFFLFWMKKQMEVFVKMDYQRGLHLLKDLIETGKTNSELKFKGIKKFYGKQYIGIKSTSTPDEIPKHMERDFTQLMQFLMQQNNKPFLSGNAVAIYHKFDVVKGKVVYIAAHPVSQIPDDLPKDFFIGKIPELKAYTIRHKGPYRHIGNAWAAGMMHQRSKKFKSSRKIPPMEIMYNSPMDTPENELVSEILFPIR